MAYVKQYFDWVGVAFVSLGIVIAFLWSHNRWLSSQNKQLASEEKSRTRIDELYLNKLVEPEVAFAQDVVLTNDGIETFEFKVDIGDVLELMVLSQKKFNIAILKNNDVITFDKAIEDNGWKHFNEKQLKELKIKPAANGDYHREVKYHFTISHPGDWKLYISKSNIKDESEMIVKFLLAYLPNNPHIR